MRRSAVRVHIVNVLGIQSRVAERKTHGSRRAGTILQGRGNVVCITGRTVTGQLGINLCAALLRVLQFLEHQNARALADYKAVPLKIEGNRSALRVLRRIERRELHEARNPDRGDARLRAARQHDIRVAADNGAKGLTDVVCAGCTGRHNVDVLAL